MNQRNTSIILMIINFILVYVIMMYVFAPIYIRIPLSICLWFGLYQLEKWIIYSKPHRVVWRKKQNIKSKEDKMKEMF